MRRSAGKSIRVSSQAAGFTLVELLVVLIIVAVLAAIIVPIFGSSDQRLNRQTCMNNLHVIGLNLAQYREDYGVFPAAPLPEYLQTFDPGYLPYGVLPMTLDAVQDTGTPDDLTPTGVYAGDHETYRLRVKIVKSGDGVNNPDEFEWYEWWQTDPAVAVPADEDWQGPYGPEPITAPDAGIALRNGLGVKFATSYAHATATTWTISLSPDVPQDWTQWRQAPAAATAQPIAAGDDTTSGAGRIVVSDPVWLDFLAVNSPVRIHSAENDELVLVRELYADGFTTHRDLTQDYPAGSKLIIGYTNFTADAANTADVHYDPLMHKRFAKNNFGLAQLNRIYKLAKQKLHCPQISDTEDVTQSANLTAAGEQGPGRRFDPLWSGYNTYDVTYNYDQYVNAILRFDALLGYGDIDDARQLKNANAPADTVVCWCYGHRPDSSATFALGNPDAPDLLGTPYTVGNDVDRAAAEKDNTEAVRRYAANQADNKVIVLWQDGSVNAVSPILARGRTDLVSGTKARAYYYAVPPFLLAPGDLR